VKLIDFGYPIFDRLLLENEISIADDSYLMSVMEESFNDFKSYVPNFKLLYLSVAVENIIRNGANIDWCLAKVKILSRDPYWDSTSAAKSKIDSSEAAELISGGLLCQVFGSLRPEPVGSGIKAPDFRIIENGYIEVYCPQESVTNIDSVKKQHEAQADQVSTVAFSYPLTGQEGSARTYTANKIIDRCLNGKREKDQTRENAVNLLWVDLIHGFDVFCCDTQPIKTALKADACYTGSFGVWHAFYGKKDKSIFSPGRTELNHLSDCFGFYKQQKEGLFRVRRSLHGAILLTVDGIVFYENPWALNPLPEDVKRKITKLIRFRADFSWFQYGGGQLNSSVVENELSKIEWLYHQND